MRSKWNVVGIRQVRNSLRLADSSGARYVGLHYVESPIGQKVIENPTVAKTLPTSYSQTE